MIFRLLSLAFLVFFLAACADDVTPTPAAPAADEAAAAAPTASPEPTVEPATAAPTVTAAPPPTATPRPKRLTVCMAAEPESLFLYGPGGRSAAAVWEAIYDGPIDSLDYDYQPVILESIPTLASGEAVLETVAVESGDQVMDANGSLVRLAQGMLLQPAGCDNTGCAVIFDGTSIEMEQLVVDFRLLPGLLWADGAPLTAADSVFSFEVARQISTASGAAVAGQGLVPPRLVNPIAVTAEYTALDEQTVRWVGLPGFRDTNYRTNFFSPLPQHQLADMPPGDLQMAQESARLPLGWGPFMLSEWREGEAITASRNPNYFRAGEGLPYFDEVVFRFELGEAADYLAALQSGECDLLTRDVIGADRQPYFELQEAGELALHVTAGPVWERLDFAIDAAEDYQRPAFFADLRLRQAVVHCIDREQLSQRLTGGLAPVAGAYIAAEHPLAAELPSADYGYDPQLGRELLAGAGWRDEDGDGVRESYGVAGIADGTPFQIEYYTLPDAFRQQMAELIAADLAACGMEVNINTVLTEQFFASSVDGPVFGRRFDLAQFAWLSGVDPACHLFQAVNIPRPINAWSGSNSSGYASPEFDQYCDAAQQALPGSSAYRENHLAALALFGQDLPVLPLLWRSSITVSRPDLAGLALNPTESAETWSLELLRIE